MKKIFSILAFLFVAIGYSQVLFVNGSTTAGNTDQQQLTISGDTLYLQNGGFIFLGPYLDNTDSQVFDQAQLNGNILELSLSGDAEATKTISLAAFSGSLNPYTPAQYAALTQPQKDTLNAVIVDDTAQLGVFTDDQTAAEVTIADSGALITATDVEGALAENRTAININTAKVGLTTDQTNQLLNAPLPPKSEDHTADFTLAADDDINDTAASSDIGRRLQQTVVTANTVTVTVPDLGAVDDVYRFYTGHASAQMNIIQGAGITINFIGKSGEDGVQVAGFDQYAFMRKTAASTYTISGDIAAYSVPATNYWPTGNAASPGADESASVAVFTTNPGPLVSVEGTDVYEGDDSINYTYTSGSEAATFTLSGLTASTTYTISAFTKKIAGTLSTTIRIPGGQITEGSSVFLFADNTSWTEKTGVFTPTGTSVTFEISVSGTQVGGEQGRFDNIVINEQ